VLGALHPGPMRFSQLRNSLTPISERMLILSLKELENARLICREETEAHAPSSTYRLTTVGISLLNHVRDLFLWMNTNAPSILAAYAPDQALQPDLEPCGRTGTD
jgi:DNA-binding HxlR family transcriptional regulator